MVWLDEVQLLNPPHGAFSFAHSNVEGILERLICKSCDAIVVVRCTYPSRITDNFQLQSHMTQHNHNDDANSIWCCELQYCNWCNWVFLKLKAIFKCVLEYVNRPEICRMDWYVLHVPVRLESIQAFDLYNIFGRKIVLLLFIIICCLNQWMYAATLTTCMWNECVYVFRFW